MEVVETLHHERTCIASPLHGFEANLVACTVLYHMGADIHGLVAEYRAFRMIWGVPLRDLVMRPPGLVRLQVSYPAVL